MQVEKAVPKRWIDSGGSPACNSKRKDNNPEKNFWRTLRSGQRVVMDEDCNRTGVNVEITVGVSEEN